MEKRIGKVASVGIENVIEAIIEDAAWQEL